MRKLLLSSAIALPLAGCGFIMDYNVFESYKNWCEETWGAGWPCTVEYARDDRDKFLSYNHAREKEETHD